MAKITPKMIAIFAALVWICQVGSGYVMQFFGLDSVQGIAGTALGTLFTSAPILFLWYSWGKKASQE